MKEELRDLVLKLQSKGLDDASLLAAKIYKKAQVLESAESDFESRKDEEDRADSEEDFSDIMGEDYQNSCMYMADTLMSIFDLNTIAAQETFTEEIFGMCEKHEPPEEFLVELATFIKAVMED